MGKTRVMRENVEAGLRAGTVDASHNHTSKTKGVTCAEGLVSKKKVERKAKKARQDDGEQQVRRDIFGVTTTYILVGRRRKSRLLRLKIKISTCLYETLLGRSKLTYYQSLDSSFRRCMCGCVGETCLS